MQRALEAMAMEGQTEGKATFPPFAQRIFERGLDQGKLDGLREGKLDGLREGKLDGLREGKLEGKLDGLREALLRLLARAGISLTEDERARIEACTDSSVLDRWIENVLGARTASDVLV